MAQGILEPIEHPTWLTPVVPVVKRNGDVSLCGNYSCTLNKVIKVEPHPMPAVQEILAMLGGNKAFEMLDMAQAYQQLKVDQETANLQAIVPNTSGNISGKSVAVWNQCSLIIIPEVYKFTANGHTRRIVESKNLFHYLNQKNTAVKPFKRTDYTKAIEEIRKGIQAISISDGNTEDNNDTERAASLNNSTNVNDGIDSSKSNERKRSMSTDKRNEFMPKKELIYNKTDGVEDFELQIEENQNATTVKTENIKIDPDKSSRKSQAKTLASANIKMETGKSANTTSIEISLATAELAEKEGNKGNHAHAVKGEYKSDTSKNASPVVAFSQFKLVTDYYLQAIIAYAEHVKDKEEVYKNKPVEEREIFKNEIVVAKLPSGEYIGIKYNQDPPPAFDNEFERAEYDEAKAKAILSLKSLLEDGKCNPAADDPNLFEIELQINEEEIQNRIKSDISERHRSKLRWFINEVIMLRLDVKIKIYLDTDKADPKTALEYLDRMMQLDIDSLMLKKQPHVVDMIRRLQRYIGNVEKWNLTNEQRAVFQIYAKNIRERAKNVYKKFMDLFHMTDEMHFWHNFTKEVQAFRHQVKGMQESEVLALYSEPNSRQAFLNRLNEEVWKKLLNQKRKNAENP